MPFYLNMKQVLLVIQKTVEQKDGVKIAAPLKYLSKFWRSLEMPLINCKGELLLEWIENCVLTTPAIDANAEATGADSATFKITDAKLYVLIVTLSAKDNAKLSKLLGEGFKRSIHWNKYKVIDNIEVSVNNANEGKCIRELLDASYQGVKRLFLLMIIQQVIIKFLLILSKDIFFQELK